MTLVVLLVIKVIKMSLTKQREDIISQAVSMKGIRYEQVFNENKIYDIDLLNYPRLFGCSYRH